MAISLMVRAGLCNMPLASATVLSAIHALTDWPVSLLITLYK